MTTFRNKKIKLMTMNAILLLNIGTKVSSHFVFIFVPNIRYGTIAILRPRTSLRGTITTIM